MSGDGKIRNLDSPTRPRSTHVRAKKSFGQNFLVDDSVVEDIVLAVHPCEGETIIEIGPGHGALTSPLLEAGVRLVAIEFDRDLVPLLRKEFGASDKFTLIEGDALLVDLCAAIVPATSARLVANLPYYISTAIIQRLLKQCECLTEITLMLQREVADRITAPPSTSERGYLSVLVEAYAEVEKLFDVEPTAFRPSPKVWSTVVRLNPQRSIPAEVENEARLWQLVSAGFAQRRKTILNNLRGAQGAFLLANKESVDGVAHLLESAGIDPQRRAETLTLEEWVCLSRALETKQIPEL